MHCESAQYRDRDRVGHVAPDASRHGRRRDRAGGECVVANDVVLIVANNETPGGALPVIVSRPIKQPLGEAG